MFILRFIRHRREVRELKRELQIELLSLEIIRAHRDIFYVKRELNAMGGKERQELYNVE